MVTFKGIEANPKEIVSIINLQKPKRDLQLLNGMSAALSMFLSKLINKSLLFFKTLRGHLGKANIS